MFTAVQRIIVVVKDLLTWCCLNDSMAQVRRLAPNVIKLRNKKLEFKLLIFYFEIF